MYLHTNHRVRVYRMQAQVIKDVSMLSLLACKLCFLFMHACMIKLESGF